MEAGWNEYRKLSPEEKDERNYRTFTNILTEMKDLSTSMADVKRMLADLMSEREARKVLEVKVNSLADDIQANSDAITGIHDRFTEFEANAGEKPEVEVPTADVEEKVVPIDNAYMPGTLNMLRNIEARNAERNQNISWRREGNGPNMQQGPNMRQGPELKPDVPNSVGAASGRRTIYSDSWQQEDRVIKLWELAKVDADHTMFDQIWMWWPDKTEVSEEDFNTINFFEEGLGVQQVNWCKSLIYVPDRSMYVQHGDDNISRNSETCAKLDDQFRKHAPEFVTEDNVIFFEDYLERFWMATRRYHMTNHQLCKEILYEKCTGVRAACGYTLKPTDIENRRLTFKGFMCKMRDMFLPPDMKNVCKDAYLNVKQHENDKIDAFFDKILSFWRRAYPEPNNDAYMDFYSQVCNVILSPTLANQMRQFALDLERDGQVRNIPKFRVEILTRAQLIVKGLQHNQISGSMARGCASNQMVLARTMIGGTGSKDNPITIDQVSDDDSNDIYQLEIDLADEFDGPQELLAVIGAVQGNFVCFYCNRKGHLMRGCFDIRDKKLPNPNGKYFKRYGNKPFIPYKKKEEGKDFGSYKKKEEGKDFFPYKKKVDGKDNKKVIGEVKDELVKADFQDGFISDEPKRTEYDDELVAEVAEWNQAIIDEIQWY